MKEVLDEVLDQTIRPGDSVKISGKQHEFRRGVVVHATDGSDMVTVKNNNASSSRRRGIKEKEISRGDLTRKAIPTPVAVTWLGALAEKAASGLEYDAGEAFLAIFDECVAEQKRMEADVGGCTRWKVRCKEHPGAEWRAISQGNPEPVTKLVLTHREEEVGGRSGVTLGSDLTVRGCMEASEAADKREKQT